MVDKVLGGKKKKTEKEGRGKRIRSLCENRKKMSRLVFFFFFLFFK